MAETSLQSISCELRSHGEDCNEEVLAHSPCWKYTACRRGSGVQNARVEAGYTRKEVSGRRDGPSYELDSLAASCVRTSSEFRIGEPGSVDCRYQGFPGPSHIQAEG